MNRTATVANQMFPARRGRVALVVLWTIQVALAGMFLMVGTFKLTGAPAMIGLFDAIGIGQWFRYVTGAIEVTSALALLVPSLAPFGAAALVGTMAGAVVTHLFIVGGSPAVPLVLLLGALGVWFSRREQCFAVLSRVF
jgi:putative oxidoreductase